MIYAIFFLSGVSGLIFQNIWFRQAGLVFGNSVWASSLVLSSFMAGLAIGNGLAGALRRPRIHALKWYASLESIVAVTGVGLVFILPALGEGLVPALVRYAGSGAMLGVVRVTLAFAILVVPTVAMGMTLPVLVGRNPSPDRFGATLGMLYGWNTLGAVLGAVAGEGALYGWFGLRGTAFIAGTLNAIAAVLSLLLVRTDRDTPDVAPHREPFAPRPNEFRLLIIAAIAGACLLALEVIWTRFLLLFVLGTALSFAIMLALVLAGVALGSLLASRAPRLCAAPTSIAILALLAAIGVTGSYASFADILRSTAPTTPWMHWSRVAPLAAALVFPASLISGALFTSIGTALARGRDGSQATGLLTLANTLGAMVGALFAGFVLLPRLGMERSFWFIAALYVLAALLSPDFLVLLKTSRPLVVTAVAGLSFTALFPVGLMERNYLRGALSPFLNGPAQAKIAGFREGLTETVTYVQALHEGEPLYTRLVTNSFSMSATTFAGRRYMETFVYLPVAIHPQVRRALLISYGVGSTARALVETREIESIDVVDISKDILEMAPLAVAQGDKAPLADPRVHAHVEDGRFFLQTTGAGYDLITSEPPPPHVGGVVNLYTLEYFRLLKSRLNPGGIVSYWLPVHSLSDNDSRAILSAFCAAFEDCTLWKGMDLDWIMLGTNGLEGAVGVPRFEQQWAARGPEDLRTIGLEAPEQLGALFMAEGRAIPGVSTTLPLQDNFPGRLSHAPPAALAFGSWRRDLLDAAAAEQRFAKSAFIDRHWPAAMKERSLPFFKVQAAFDAMMVEIEANRRVEAAAAAIVPLFVVHRLSVLPSILLGIPADLRVVTERLERRNIERDWMSGPLGIRDLTNGNYRSAAERLQKALERQPGSLDLRRGLILALCLDGRRQDAAAARLQLPPEIRTAWSADLDQACLPPATNLDATAKNKESSQRGARPRTSRSRAG